MLQGASMKQGPKLLPVIFIGDRVADVARALGCYPTAMIGGQIPMIEKEFPFARQLECVLCVMGSKRKILLHAYKKMQIEYVVIENTKDSPNPASIAPELEAQGLKVAVLDFTRGMEQAIHDAGRIFNMPKKAEKVASDYKVSLEQSLANLPQLGKRVVTLLGISNPQRSDSFLLAETPGGYIDSAVLGPLGCINAAGPMLSSTEETVMDGIQLLRSFTGLEEANPDVIALTGDPLVGQRALRSFVQKHPETAATIPALKKLEIYALPHCCSANPMEYPQALALWKQALSG
jgi:ABC-type Fe3+-hydroxamate transport system substrate-binding protein